MAKFLRLFLGLLLWGAFPLLAEASLLALPPAPESMVLDQAELLNAEEEVQLDGDLQAFEKETSTEIVVVTVTSLQGLEPEQFALELGRAWGIGQKETDNGVVFLIAPTERAARIEVGYGLEGVLTDAQSFQILDTLVLPAFKKEEFSQGIFAGVEALKTLARGESFPFPELEEPPNYEAIFNIILFSSLFLFNFLAQSRSWFLGGIIGGIAGALLFQTLWAAIGLGLLGFGVDFVASKYFFKIGTKGGFGGGFGGSRGGSGGGFGGFGGGSFGGGGATGRW